jgi:hypothetical protein
MSLKRGIEMGSAYCSQPYRYNFAHESNEQQWQDACVRFTVSERMARLQRCSQAVVEAGPEMILGNACRSRMVILDG